jgi:hypothetical protein
VIGLPAFSVDNACKRRYPKRGCFSASSRKRRPDDYANLNELGLQFLSVANQPMSKCLSNLLYG